MHTASLSSDKKVYAQIDLTNYDVHSKNIVTISVNDDSKGVVSVYGVTSPVDAEAANYLNQPGNNRFGAGVNLDEVYGREPFATVNVTGSGDYEIDVSDYAEYMTEAGYNEGYLMFVSASDSSAFEASEDFDDGKINYTQLQGGEILSVVNNPLIVDTEDLYGNGKALRVKFVATYDRIYIDFLGADSITEDDIGRTFEMTYWYKAEKASTLQNALRKAYSDTTEQVSKTAYTTPGEWAQITYNFEITETAVESGILCLDFRCAVTDNTAYYDNIVVKEVNAGTVNFGFKQITHDDYEYYFTSDVEDVTLKTVSSNSTSTSDIIGTASDEIAQDGTVIGINGFGAYTASDGTTGMEVWEISNADNHSTTAGAEKSYHFSIYNSYPRLFLYNMFKGKTASELTAGDKYTVSFWLKASRAGSFQTSITNVSGHGSVYNGITHTVSEANVGKWVKYSYVVTITEDMISNNKALVKITNWSFKQSSNGIVDIWVDDFESSKVKEVEVDEPYSYTNSFNALDDGYLYGGFHGHYVDGNLIYNEYGTWADCYYNPNVNRGVNDTTSGSVEAVVTSISNRVYLTDIVADDMAAGDKYKVSFYLKSDTAGSMNISMSHSKFAGLAYTGETTQTITVTEDEVGTWKLCEFEFTVTEEMLSATANNYTYPANMLYLRVASFLSSTVTTATLNIDDVTSNEIVESDDTEEDEKFVYTNGFNALLDGYSFGGFHGHYDENNNLIYNDYGTWADCYYNPNVNRGVYDTTSGSVEAVVTSNSNRVYLTNVVPSMTADDVDRTFKVSFYIKSDTAGSMNVSMSNSALQGNSYTGEVKKVFTISEDEVGTWKKCVYDFTITNELVNATSSTNTGAANYLFLRVSDFLTSTISSVTLNIDDVKSVEIFDTSSDIYATAAKTVSAAELSSKMISVSSEDTSSDSAEKVRKAYLRFDADDWVNSQKAILNVDVVSANGQTLKVYGLSGQEWPDEAMSWANAPGAGVDEKMINGGAVLAEATVTESGIYSFDVSDYVKNQGTSECIFVITSDAVGGTEYVNIDFESQGMIKGVDYVSDSLLKVVDGEASISGNKIALLNIFGNANKKIKAGAKYTISADVTATGDVSIGVAAADGTVGESATYTLSGESEKLTFVYTATEEDEENGVCAVSIEAVNAGFSVDNVSVSSEDVVVLSKDCELLVDFSSEPDVDALEQVTLTVSTINGNSVVINGTDKGDLATEKVYTGTVLEMCATGDGEFMYWIDADANTILSYDETYSFTVGSDRNIAAVYSDSENVFVTFTSLANKVVAMGTTSSITVPSDPYVYGYKFNGWYIDGEKTDLASGGTVSAEVDTEYKAGFVKEDTSYKVTVNGVESEYAYNEKVTCTAETETDDGTFSYWTKDGEIVSYNASYSFYVSGETVVTAVYGKSAESDIILVMSAPVLVGTDKIAFFAERDIPEDYEIIETGILMGTSAGLTVDNAKYKAVAKSTANKGQYTVRKKDVANGDTYYGAAYVIYRDETGTLNTAYSNEVSYTLNNTAE